MSYILASFYLKNLNVLFYHYFHLRIVCVCVCVYFSSCEPLFSNLLLTSVFSEADFKMLLLHNLFISLNLDIISITTNINQLSEKLFFFKLKFTYVCMHVFVYMCVYEWEAITRIRLICKAGYHTHTHTHTISTNIGSTH